MPAQATASPSRPTWGRRSPPPGGHRLRARVCRPQRAGPRDVLGRGRGRRAARPHDRVRHDRLRSHSSRRLGRGLVPSRAPLMHRLLSEVDHGCDEDEVEDHVQRDHTPSQLARCVHVAEPHRRRRRCREVERVQPGRESRELPRPVALDQVVGEGEDHQDDLQHEDEMQARQPARPSHLADDDQHRPCERTRAEEYPGHNPHGSPVRVDGDEEVDREDRDRQSDHLEPGMRHASNSRPVVGLDALVYRCVR